MTEAEPTPTTITITNPELVDDLWDTGYLFADYGDGSYTLYRMLDSDNKGNISVQEIYHATLPDEE